MTTERITGRVKWFNNKAGYGFITLVGDDKNETDIFVHHSYISLTDQYRYLVQGEYVEFSLVPTVEGSTHKFQAGDVKGINGGMLMCETRKNLRTGRAGQNEAAIGSNEEVVIEATPRPVRSANVRGSGPRQLDVTPSVNDDKVKGPMKKRGRPPRAAQSKESV
jgi:cold shock CspA family protein